MSRVDLSEIKALLAERAEDLGRAIAGDRPVVVQNDKMRLGENGRFKIELRGARRGLWCDHATRTGGDGVDLIAAMLGLDGRGARAWAMDWLGIADGVSVPRAAPRRPEPVMRDPASTVDLALRIWREAVPPAGTLVETYLASRGLVLEPDVPIRFHPSCPRASERWPAMVALMTDPVTGKACGVHRTFLARSGGGKASGVLPTKMMAGHAGIVRLTAEAEVTAGLGIAEGIETALAVMQGFSWRPVWAATSAGAIRTFPLLHGIQALTIFADPDGVGTDAAQHCAARWIKARREARVCTPPAGDFNDIIRERVV